MVIRILTYGDSLTEGNAKKAVLSKLSKMPFTYQSKLYEVLDNAGFDVEVVNEGIGGQIATEIADRIKEITECDYLVITAGTNDCWRWSDFRAGMPDFEEFKSEMVEETWNFIREAVLEVREKVRFQIVIVSIPPIGEKTIRALPKYMKSTINEINKRYKTFCEENGFVYCDLHKTMTDSQGFLRHPLHSGDGVHFSIEGNAIFGETVGVCMKNLLEKDRK